MARQQIELFGLVGTTAPQTAEQSIEPVTAPRRARSGLRHRWTPDDDTRAALRAYAADQCRVCGLYRVRWARVGYRSWRVYLHIDRDANGKLFQGRERRSPGSCGQVSLVAHLRTR